MLVLSVARILKRFAASESGATFMETLVALSLSGIIVVVFLSGLATASRATIIADEKGTAQSLAQTQMETVKKTGYIYDASEYALAAIPTGSDYSGYSVTIVAQPLHNPDDGIQKIMVTVHRSGREILTLMGYKSDR